MVQTLTPKVSAKIEDIKQRWAQGAWRRQIPSSYLELLPSRGAKQSLVRVTLESPADVMAEGKMPVSHAKLRRYEYDPFTRT